MDNITAPATGAVLATDDILGVHYPRTKISFGADGAASDVATGNPFPVTIISGGGLTDAQIRATPLPVSGSVSVTGAVAVTGTFWQATQPVSGTIGVSGSVAVTGPVTDTQLRATALPISGTVGISGAVAVTGTFWQATQPVSGNVGVTGSVAVTGTFFQATQPISAAALPLPTGASTEATLATMSAKLPVQAAVSQSTKTLVAATAQTLVTASANNTGARILNYTAAPVYLTSGTTGIPTSGAPSDYIPAAAAGVPGQWESPFKPVDGIRGVGASAGDLTVIVW